MDITISSLERTEFEDLLTVSAANDDTKKVIMDQFTQNKIATDTFLEILYVLRIEDQLDRQIQQDADTLANFDPEAYTKNLQRIIEGAIEKHFAATKKAA